MGKAHSSGLTKREPLIARNPLQPQSAEINSRTSFREQGQPAPSDPHTFPAALQAAGLQQPQPQPRTLPLLLTPNTQLRRSRRRESLTTLQSHPTHAFAFHPARGARSPVLRVSTDRWCFERPRELSHVLQRCPSKTEPLLTARLPCAQRLLSVPDQRAGWERRDGAAGQGG